MEINMMQCVLIGLWSAICLTGMLMGTFLTRCLVMAAGVGVILGDIPAGLAMGAVGELAFLGFGVSQGGSVPPSPVGPGIIGTILLITMKESGMDAASALALSFPFAVAVQFMITGVYTAVTALTGAAQYAVEHKRFGLFRLIANSTILIFLALGFFVGFAGAYSAKGLQAVIELIPEWLNAGLGTAGRMLPAIGFAMILSVMIKRELIPFVFVGYIAAAYLKLPIIGVTLVGAVAAMIEYIRESGQEIPPLLNQGPEKKGLAAGILTKRDYTKTALRAYFLQNSYNYGNYEGFGYVYVMFPALRKLYTNDDDLKNVMKENMGFCSTNPNFLPIITSLHLVMLEHNAPKEEIQNIRLALMGPLAGIGDSFVQFCLAPLFATIGASMAQDGLLLGPVFFLIAMNGILVAIKLCSSSWGYQLGGSIVDRLAGRMQQVSKMAGIVGVTVISGLVVNFVKITTPLEYVSGNGTMVSIQGMLDTIVPNLLPAAFTGLIFFLIKKKHWNMYQLVLLTLAGGIILTGLGVLG